MRTITSDPGFGDFLTKTSLLMERALNVNFDVIIDSGKCLPSQTLLVAMSLARAPPPVIPLGV